MAGNSKKSRKPKPPQTRPTAVASRIATAFPHTPLVVGDFMNPNSFVKKASDMARTCMEHIVNQVGNFDDWNKLMHRMYAGSIAYTDYFKPDDGVAAVLNDGVASLQLIMVRTHCIGIDGFGMRPSEHQRIQDALELIDRLTRNMKTQEVRDAYEKAGWWLDHIVAENKKASDLFYEKQKMLNQLAQEYQTVQTTEGSSNV
jgi:hypothetical protein